MQVPARGTWARSAVIHGELLSLGLALAVAAAGLVLAPLLGAMPWWVGLLALAPALAAAWLVRWTRAAYRALLAEVVAAHEGDDPGPSPVAWLDEALWRERNRFDPTLDAQTLLMSEVDQVLQPYGRDASGAFTEPALRPVLEAERDLATPSELPEGVRVPEPGSGEELLARLASTPGRFIAVGPRWPVCCRRPATLQTVVLARRHPDAVVLPPEPGEVVDPVVHGHHGYQCRACGRRWATDPTW